MKISALEVHCLRMPAEPCVFIDRDGTLVEEVEYINHSRRLRLLPRSATAVRLLNEAGIRAVVVTNQSGVARGFFSEKVLDAAHAELVAQLQAEGAFLDGIYVCPHHPTEGKPPYRIRCDCRKPEPGLFFRASKDLNLDLSASYTVGDKITDVEAGRRAGLTSILVLTGYGLGEWKHRRAHWTVRPKHVAADLLDAVEWVLERRRTQCLRSSVFTTSSSASRGNLSATSSPTSKSAATRTGSPGKRPSWGGFSTTGGQGRV